MDSSDEQNNLAEFKANIATIEELSSRLVAALANKRDYDHGLAGPGGDLLYKAASAFWGDPLTGPTRMLEQQVEYWGKTFQNFADAQASFTNTSKPEEGDASNDPRFSNPLWNTNPYFALIKHQYSLNVETLEKTLAEVENLAPRDKQRLEYFTRQIIDALAPTNFLATNPDALERAVETNGQSLVDGLKNLVHDIEQHQGEILVTLADEDAFTVGKNIASTEGSVVFRNHLFELIQFEATTEKVKETPVVFFPPWINKYYVLDLKEKNSLIKWLTDQGFTVFVVSWKNPDASYADVGVDTYMSDGYLTAIEQVKAATGQDQVNAVGYCIGGTTLALTAAYLAKKNDASLKTATFFTTVTDFSEQREFTPFLQNDFVDGIEREAAAKGMLDRFFMSRTFSFLRSNDLIYRPAIRNYMMGEKPPAFDLLYWNGDSTNLPARMVVEYLRQLCQGNHFAEGKFEVLGETLSIKDVDVPLFAVACETDHIANWEDSYRGVSMMSSPNKTFVLSESGHIAGIVNPPSKKKYGHFLNPDLPGNSDDWRDGSKYFEGSWWPRWAEWLAEYSGNDIAARKESKIICPAPGTYVLER